MSSIDAARRVLEEGMSRVGAFSSTFYVRDPQWPGEFALLLMPGVVVREPMHGFMLPNLTRARISLGDDFEFYPDAGTDPNLSAPLLPPLRDLAVANQIFHDFALREGVASCARILQRKGKHVHASLFVNFREHMGMTESLRSELLGIMERLASHLDGIAQDLQARYADEASSLLWQLARILKPVEIMAAQSGSGLQTQPALEEFLAAILDAVLQAFRIETDEGHGTIHILQPNTGKLRFESMRGRSAEVCDSSTPGDGVISWVALKKRAVLIEDILESPFRRIYRPVAADMRSELAVPMLAGNELIGVINVESTQPRKFSAGHVRTLWCAANQAAVALHLCRQASAHQAFARKTEELLDFYQEATSADSSAANRLQALAGILRDWTGADQCEVWRYEPEAEVQFVRTSVSPAGIRRAGRPRNKGWTQFALTNQMNPVWLSFSEGSKAYDVRTWNDAESLWELPAGDVPAGANTRVRHLGTHSQLGIPIPLLNEAIGVAWMTYFDAAGPLSSDLMRAVTGLVANAGMVMDFVARYDENKRSAEEELRSEIVSYSHILFPTRELSDRQLSLYIRTEPKDSPIGGDFYAIVKLDGLGRRIGVLLGDGEGHGIPAALKMLPVYTAFRLACMTTGSTKYVLERLCHVVYDLRLPNTSAIYFIIDLERKRPMIHASCAGHPSLLVLDKSTENWGKILHYPPPSKKDMLLTGISREPRLGEMSEELDYGTVLIAYTDGIVDAGIATRKPFGIEGVITAALSRLNEKPKVIADCVFESAKRHAGGVLEDDGTVLVLTLDEAGEGAGTE